MARGAKFRLVVVRGSNFRFIQMFRALRRLEKFGSPTFLDIAFCEKVNCKTAFFSTTKKKKNKTKHRMHSTSRETAAKYKKAQKTKLTQCECMTHNAACGESVMRKNTAA